MSFRARLFALPMPGFLRRAFLGRLFRLTADAFGAQVPAPGGSLPEILDQYAAFTRAQAEIAMEDSARTANVQQRLYTNALSLGGRLRSLLGVRGMPEALDAARTLYRLIGVDFRGAAAGTAAARTAAVVTAAAGAAPVRGQDGAGCDSACFSVSRCSFSRHYPPEVCRLISSLDAGLLAGLTGGSKMTFTERIT